MTLEDRLGELPDLIKQLEDAVDDLRTAETCEKDSDLFACVLEALGTIAAVQAELRTLIRK